MFEYENRHPASLADRRDPSRSLVWVLSGYLAVLILCLLFWSPMTSKSCRADDLQAIAGVVKLISPNTADEQSELSAIYPASGQYGGSLNVITNVLRRIWRVHRRFAPIPIAFVSRQGQVKPLASLWTTTSVSSSTWRAMLCLPIHPRGP